MEPTEEVTFKCTNCYTPCTLMIDIEDEVTLISKQVCVEDLEAGGADWVLIKKS